MSRGIGALQRQILDALVQRRDNDSYDAADIPEYAEDPVIRARWRWYTVDLLDMVEFGAPRSERVSLHRAVHSLHNRRLVQVATACPYDQPFGSYQNEYGERVGGLDLAELSTVDPRWPSGQGRCLWFRLPVSAWAEPDLPRDDQMVILNKFLEQPGDFRPESWLDFIGTLNRQEVWRSEFGRFARWLFCGPMPVEQRGL